jgi:hypothetical protein
LSLDACLEKLRYVKYGDEVRASDVLTKLECLKALRDTLKAKAAEMGCPSERIDPLVDQLDSIIAMIRYVRSGDIIQPEDHNYIVNALRKARDILAEIETFCAGIKDQLDKCVADLSKCQSDLASCLKMIETALSVPISPYMPMIVAPEVTVEVSPPLPPIVAPEVRAEITPPLPPILVPEVAVITTWNNKGIEVQIT